MNLRIVNCHNLPPLKETISNTSIFPLDVGEESPPDTFLRNMAGTHPWSPR